jgi:hypothetical protein
MKTAVATHSVLSLQGLEPFGRGGKRECYVHPDDPLRCVKVNRVGYEPATLWKRASWFRRWRKSEEQFDKNYRDWEVLDRLEAERDPAIWKHLPRCYGWVETDLGRGLMIELIRDPDGQISRSFKDYLWNSGYDERARKAVDEFAAYWDAFPIPTRTLVLYNFAAQIQPDNSLRLVFIDGMGDTEFLPLGRISQTLARWKSARKLRDMRQRIEDLLRQRERGDDPGKWGFLLSRR